MKTRVISAVVGLAILAVVLFFFNTIVLNVAVAVVSVLAVYELLLATKYIQNKLLAVTTLITAALVPFINVRIAYLRHFMPAAIILYIFLLFIMMLVRHDTMHIEHVGFSCFVSFLVPMSFSTLIWFRDSFPMSLGLLYFLLALGGAWLSDAGAYFTGLAFGKHKLAPNISPSKTVEGAVGGVAVCVILYVFITAVYSSVSAMFGAPMDVNYICVACVAVASSAAGILGDLSASIIKRQCAIKDFGSIMPGHGGILDRFDSVLFSAPVIYLVAMYLPMILLK